MAGATDWIVWTMADLHPQPNSSTNGAFVTAAPDPGSYLSLAAGLTAWVVAQSSGADSGRVTRLRHQEALKTALAALTRAADLAGAAPELLSEDIRAAARALERIVGRINPEDVLDRVFASFCIGK
jgi:tRNA modification GTPase